MGESVASNYADYQTPHQAPWCPFRIEELLVFDEATLAELLIPKFHAFTVATLAVAMQSAPTTLVERIQAALPDLWHADFADHRHAQASARQIATAQQQVLDAFFWELIYWQMPESYEELIAGEQLHPGIFQQLQPDIRGRIVADIGAGSGRATFDCLPYAPRSLYAIEPAPLMRALLTQKIAAAQISTPFTLLSGSFNHLPLADQSVDVALSCAAFTVDDLLTAQRHLAELQRITRPGGKIIMIWPRPQDLPWLKQQGFQHIVLSHAETMTVRYASLSSALRLAHRFYRDNPTVTAYLQHHQTPIVPYSILGVPQPDNYCWLRVGLTPNPLPSKAREGEQRRAWPHP